MTFNRVKALLEPLQPLAQKHPQHDYTCIQMRQVFERVDRDRMSAALPWVSYREGPKFADSQQEEGGFEPSVPLLRRGLPSVVDGRSRADRLDPVLSSGPLARRRWLRAARRSVPSTWDRDFESRLLQR